MDMMKALRGSEGRLVEKLNEKADSTVLLMEKPDGRRFVLRIYRQEVPAYQALADHECSCIPKIIRCTQKEGLFLVEEEWIDGISLQEMLDAGGAMDGQRAVHVALAVCTALEELNQAGFIHRDVKPEHVMLTAEQRVVLIDLDASMRILPEKKNDTRLLGTATYAAPEQFGLARSDVRTDIYAVGILLNILLTGNHPAVVRYRKGKLADVIETCTKINPQERYQSIPALQAALQDGLKDMDGGGDEKKPVSAGKKRLDRNRRKIGLLSAGAFGMILLALMASVFLPGAFGTDGGDEGAAADLPGKIFSLDDVNQANGEDGKEGGDEQEPGDGDDSEEDNPDKDGASVSDQDAKPTGAETTEPSENQKPSGNTKPSGSTSKPTGGTSKPSGSTSSSGSASNGDPEEETQWRQLYKEYQRETIYYNYRQGAQCAPLYTEDGAKVDQSYEVYADPAVGQVIGWDSGYGGWRLVSEGCEMGATGYLHAKKDGKHYAIQVLVMGEPISAYTSPPAMTNLAAGYLKPASDMYYPNQKVIHCTYDPAKKKVLYLASMYGFHNLTPTCSNQCVTIEKYSGQKSWPFNLFVMTFSNPGGGEVYFEVPNEETSLTFVFEEA